MAAPLYGDAALDLAIADVTGEPPEPCAERLIGRAASRLYQAQDFRVGFLTDAALTDAACDLSAAAAQLIGMAAALHRLADECEAEAEASTPNIGALLNKLVAVQTEFRALARVR